MSKEIILLKLGEIVLKGLNRKSFEKVLLKNAKTLLSQEGEFNIYIMQSTVYVEPLFDCDTDYILKKLSKLFGVASLSKVCVCEKSIDDIKSKCYDYLYDTLSGVKTFKVEAKRADKAFPLTSPQISAEIGGHLLGLFPHLKVDLHNPEVTVTIEVRDKNAFIRGVSLRGAGGLPTGTNGKAALLLSGGIDSPVAGYMTAKRGVYLDAIYFHAYPYTGDLAKEKVISLAKELSLYTGSMYMHIVPFTEIQEEIKRCCAEPYFTIIMRRLMMQISERIARDIRCTALITGESIGQVASQTMEAMYCTDSSVNMPVFRPCIGMDKEEIVTKAREIGTFETSILPYEDCCSLFAPRHPKTKPVLEQVLAEEAKADFEPLILKAIENAEHMRITV